MKGATLALEGTDHDQGRFNSRSREGSDYGIPHHLPLGGEVSIHAPVKGATLGTLCCMHRHLRFNSRSREGSDMENIYEGHLHYVSIHAPVKGATQPIRRGKEHKQVSIHAPVKGATLQYP